MPVHPKHLPADERRAFTVEAVLELAAKQNPAEITTAEIAKHMGLTQGALFRHFPTKEAILQAVMGWVSERLLARVDQAAASTPSPLAALQAVIMAHVDFVAEHPGVPRMLFGKLQRPGDSATKRMAQTLLRHYGQRLRPLFETGIASGELDAKLDIEAATVLFVGSVQGLVMRSLLVGDTRRIRGDAPGVFAIYRRGIAAAS